MDNHSTDGIRIRASTIEGIFYPGEKKELTARVRELLDSSEAQETGRAFIIIVPHAALDYSGDVAAEAFKAAAGRSVDTVVMLGPVHREAVHAVLLPQSQFFQTPLGSVEVEEKIVKALEQRSSQFRIDDIPHLEEHCLEAQLPFIQYLFPKAKIVPILLGKPTQSLVEQLAEALWDLFSPRFASTLFVVTANMSSYTREKEGQQEVDQLLAWIKRGDWQAILEAATHNRISSCGAGCLAAILLMHNRLGGPINVVKQGSSLKLVKDPKKVVHYAAIVLRTDGE